MVPAFRLPSSSSPRLYSYPLQTAGDQTLPRYRPRWDSYQLQITWPSVIRVAPLHVPIFKLHPIMFLLSRVSIVSWEKYVANIELLGPITREHKGKRKCTLISSTLSGTALGIFFTCNSINLHNDLPLKMNANLLSHLLWITDYYKIFTY